MIDLRNTYVVIRTQEEYENILKIAEKQGFHWYGEEDATPVYFSKFPYILRFRSNYIVCFVYDNSKLNFKNCKCYEASELIKENELTAKEVSWDGRSHSIAIKLPPYGFCVFRAVSEK